MKKVAWFTEGAWTGQTPRDHENMRNDSAWMHMFNATHYPIWNVHQIQKKYDLGIVTLPKSNIDKLSQYPLIESLRKCCDKIAYMQEGPHWYFQDYALDQQCWFYNTLSEMDFLFVHNEIDRQYFQGLIGKECRLMPTLMIEDLIKDLPNVERSGVMMGGNFCHWYGGFDSYIVAQEFGTDVCVPSMGRKIDGEEQMENLTHLSYMNWLEWMRELNKYKYGVHLMRTHAAGTFALNCSYLGIPCIGYEGLDTQMVLHPDLTVPVGDITAAKKLAEKLRNDENFYLYCIEVTKMLYNEHYTEKEFIKRMKKYDTN
tara:strand:+ start:768 stop:1709 length:942 start_codon:yes stop_codon:yes gene_type:complete